MAGLLRGVKSGKSAGMTCASAQSAAVASKHNVHPVKCRDVSPRLAQPVLRVIIVLCAGDQAVATLNPADKYLSRLAETILYLTAYL